MLSWFPSLNSCDNWHGISLLDVAGKVVARVLQERLQTLAEEELPESVWVQKRQELCGHDLYCMTTSREVMGA